MTFFRNMIVTFLILSCGYLYADGVQDITDSFSLYKRSLAEQNPLLAVGFVSESSIEYYSKVRKLALIANEGVLKKQSFSKKMLALMLRVRMSVKELEDMDGRQLFMYAIKSGWVSNNSLKGSVLGDINITGATAYAGYENRGKPSNSKLVFVREEGVWKFDLVSAISDADKIFQSYAERSNVSEDKMVEVLVEKATGQKVTPALWAGFQR